MAADEGGGGGPPPSIKNEEGLFGDSNKQILLHDNDNTNHNNNNRGLSIAERRAAKCGFNASNINSDRFGPTTPSTPQLRSPYFTVPPGLSPSVLLDSPVMLPNAQAQLSPTTGTFQFPSPNDHERLKLKRKLASNGDETIAMDSSSRLHSHSALKQFDEFEYSRECFDDTLGKTQVLGHRSREADSNTRNNSKMLISHNDHHTSGVQEIRSTHPNQEKHHKGGSCVPKEMAKYAEDGFLWRKYGQKHVKGSEFPRSYYKCTDTDCLVRKKVERSHDGQITEIVYKGSHNHPQPQNFKRFSEITENMGQVLSSGSAGFKTADHHQGKDVPLYTSPDNGLDGLSFLNDFPDHQSGPISMFEPVGNQDISATFCSQDGDDQNGDSPDIISFEDDDQNGECESKKRKRESVPNETAVPRSTREPKVVVQIESDIDILEDGYKWRKYGQKVVKGNPNPRSYYKCTVSKCPVRKHVERAADDIKSVITTYEGKHNHQVPCSKTANTAANSDVANAPHTVASGNVSSSSSMAHKSIINDAPKPGKVQAQDLSLFMETKPILNYNEMMNSNNLPPPAANFAGTSSSSVYPVSFPPFHSMHYSTLMMNSNYCMNSYPISKLYPPFSDYMAMPSQVNHIPAAAGGSSANNNMMPVASNFHYNNNYPTTQTPTRAHEQVRDCHTKNTVKPKEEPKG